MYLGSLVRRASRRKYDVQSCAQRIGAGVVGNWSVRFTLERPAGRMPLMADANNYEILDLELAATADEIKAAYHRIMKIVHPSQICLFRRVPNQDLLRWVLRHQFRVDRMKPPSFRAFL